MFVLSSLSSMVGIGGGTAATAGATAATGAGAAGAAAGSVSISSILQGVATVGGLVASISAGNADQDAAELQALEAEAEQPLENLQGIARRRSLKAAAVEAIGEQDAAYAASGVDLSTGTAAVARREAFDELDVGTAGDSGTTMTRLSRLTQRAANYRRIGKRARSLGILGGLSSAAQSGARYFERG